MIIKCHHTPDTARPTYLIGHAETREAILIDPENGRHYGAHDPRRDGLALGP